MLTSMKQSGFGLTEILVTVVLLAIGLLGLASLQGVSLNRNNDSYYRQQAVMLAYDIADRMRANMAGARNPTNNNATSYHMSSTSIPSAVSCSTNCTSAQLANNDIADWATSVANRLPGGSAIVCIDNAPDAPNTCNPYPPTPASPCCGSGVAPPGTAFAAKIWWNEKEREGSGGVGQKFFTLSFRP